MKYQKATTGDGDLNTAKLVKKKLPNPGFVQGYIYT